MYAKFLFIGLGGSGGKTLRFLKRELQRWQAAHGIGGPLPTGWQFVNIDTPTVADGAELNEIVDPLPAGEYLGLMSGAVTFRAVQQSLDSRTEFQHDLCGWRPDPAGPAGQVPLLMGAGQFRAVGQSVALAYASTINEELAKRWGRLAEPGTDAELGELYRKATGNNPDPNSNVYIVVISSLAGGTGAGLLNTVCDILRASPTPDSSGDRIFALLYTPDVFDALGGAVTDGVQANALAAVSELINGSWLKGDNPIPMSDPVLAAAGLIAGQPERGPAFPFMVGRQNVDGINFGTPDRTFEMTGRSLVSWVTDVTVQRELIAYTIGNFVQAALNQPLGEILVDTGGDNKGLPLFSALGFARVNLGTDYLEDYIVKRVVRDANEHLADYHVRSEDSKRLQRDLGTADQDVISRAIAKEYLDSFLRDAGLSEYGPEENQIIDALRPDSELEEEFVQKALGMTEINHGTKKTVPDWINDITHAVDEALRTYETRYRAALEDSTCEWAETIEMQTLDTAEKHLCSRGLHVARAVCDLAADHLSREVTRDLRDEAAVRRDWHSSWRRAPHKILEGLDGRVDADCPQLEEAVREAVYLAKYVGEARLAEWAAKLCEQVAERVLTPLAHALSSAHAVAASETIAAQAWPAWNDMRPSKSFEPPISEFTIIDVAEFPGRFDEHLQQTFPKDTADGRRTKVRDAVVSGDFLKSELAKSASEYNDSRCLAVQSKWWPHTERPLDASRNPSKLRVRAQTDLHRLQIRGRQWLQRPGSPFERFLSHGIRSYLGGDSQFADDFTETDLAQHRTKFITQLNAAIKASGPLVSIDQGLLEQVHPGTSAKAHRRRFSQIPLQGHPAEPDVRAVLAAGGEADAKMKELLNNDTSVKYVDVTSLLHAPHSILVMKSLTDPVAGAWNKAKGTSAGRHNFWTCRRGKRLDRFVPVRQALLLCLVRGWFTGIAVGRIDKGRGAGPASIMRDGGGPKALFPYPLLSSPIDSDDTLACVMEALGLAHIEFGAQERPDPLQAYKSLRDLGRDGKNQMDLYVYEYPNPALQDWIDTGQFSERITEPLATLGGAASVVPAERARALSEVFDQCRNDFASRFDELESQWSQNPKLLSRAPLWTGLWPHMAEALKQLSTACRREAPEGSGVW